MPALWIAALTIKLLVWFFARDQVVLDRGVNFTLLFLAAVTIYRIARLARSGLLWGVSRKLILSYLLVGAVPILLLATFSLLALLLVLFDVSSFLVHDRIADLTAQAQTIARTSAFEAERSPADAHAIVERRQPAIAARYPGARLAVVDARTLPSWVPRDGFAGLVDDGRTVRATVAGGGRAKPVAAIVDLPVERAIDEAVLAEAGIRIGSDRPRSLFNTATFLTHVEWDTGIPKRTTLALSVDVFVLYRWLASASSRQPSVDARMAQEVVNFNQILLIMLVSIGVLLLVIEMVALGNGLALARTITSSVDELFGGTESVKSGNFDARIAVRSDDQLGQLAASFNDMTGRIQALLLEQDEKRRLEEELRIARDIQMSLLPQGTLKAPGISIAAHCAPAREVGGDYYDFFPLPDGRLGLLIADVSGKGTSAALYMAELKGLMLSLSRIYTSPRALLIEANRIISRHLDSRSFITMTYAVVDSRAGSVTCARAGHTPFVRISRHGGRVRSEVLTPDGMILGLKIDDGQRFERCLEEITLSVAAGDLFVFFTDGISEAMDTGGACFGEARLAAYIEANADRPPELIRDQLIGEVTAFAQGQPQHDDMTIVILKIESHG